MLIVKKNAMVIVLGITIMLCASCAERQEQKVSISSNTKNKIENKVDAFGTVKVKNIKNINVNFPAIVDKIFVEDGSRVKKGDIMVSLNLSEFRKQIRDKELDLDSTRIELSKTQTDINRIKANISEKQKKLNTNTDPEIKKLVSDVEYADNFYKKACEELKKKNSLLDLNIISRNDYNEFEESVISKKRALDDAQKALEILKHNKQTEIDELQSELNLKMNLAEGVDSIQLIKEKISGIESDISLMKDKISKSYIKENNIVSDMENGIVTNIGYVQGDSVDVSKKVLSIMDIDSIYISADVEEKFIKDVKVGADVNIIPTADKSRKYKGKVVEISGNAVEKDDETSIAVEIAIENKDSFLVPNFNVDIEIEIE
ncbi:CusB/HlyD membrane fusion family barrel-sandwich protein [Ruminiclostridium sufflavum DSM 19573]|uniref:CusB/HlyD membrane fusion family barrel-sandwich protein n=1 Tax=Ruminiclostridium sufflavum DSM 19573 TaxID=1121337 RepID=A0A318XGU8_9FIRM|nr:efflux RND transporter periplasmic adaptor subunit [Ruminiclostridium sufflavum]PYG83888.1 CusB/HlyD membrane fusion family barrel-sandwich protein [Ruminiclostridium sufflavum DSM 19573]